MFKFGGMPSCRRLFKIFVFGVTAESTSPKVEAMSD
jgi:hypothetical protein